MRTGNKARNQARNKARNKARRSKFTIIRIRGVSRPLSVRRVGVGVLLLGVVARLTGYASLELSLSCFTFLFASPLHTHVVITYHFCWKDIY